MQVNPTSGLPALLFSGRSDEEAQIEAAGKFAPVSVPATKAPDVDSVAIDEAIAVLLKTMRPPEPPGPPPPEIVSKTAESEAEDMQQIAALKWPDGGSNRSTGLLVPAISLLYPSGARTHVSSEDRAPALTYQPGAGGRRIPQLTSGPNPVIAHWPGGKHEPAPVSLAPTPEQDTGGKSAAYLSQGSAVHAEASLVKPRLTSEPGQPVQAEAIAGKPVRAPQLTYSPTGAHPVPTDNMSRLSGPAQILSHGATLSSYGATLSSYGATFSENAALSEDRAIGRRPQLWWAPSSAAALTSEAGQGSNAPGDVSALASESLRGPRPRPAPALESAVKRLIDRDVARVLEVRDYALKLIEDGMSIDEVVRILSGADQDSVRGGLVPSDRHLAAFVRALKALTDFRNEAPPAAGRFPAIRLLKALHPALVKAAEAPELQSDAKAESLAPPVLGESKQSAQAIANFALTASTSAAKADRPGQALAPGPIVDRLVEKFLELLQSRRVRTITLELDPPDLGNIKLTVRAQGQRVDAHVLAATQEVRALIEANRDQLIQALQSRGLELNSMFVGTQAEGRSNDSFTTPDSHRPAWRPAVEGIQPTQTVSPMLTGRWAAVGLDLSV